MQVSLLKDFRLNDPAYAGSFRISAQLSVFGRVTLLATTTRYRFVSFGHCTMRVPGFV